jgi:hypothetical protein
LPVIPPRCFVVVLNGFAPIEQQWPREFAARSLNRLWGLVIKQRQQVHLPAPDATAIVVGEVLIWLNNQGTVASITQPKPTFFKPESKHDWFQGHRKSVR